MSGVVPFITARISKRLWCLPDCRILAPSRRDLVAALQQTCGSPTLCLPRAPKYVLYLYKTGTNCASICTEWFKWEHDETSRAGA